MNRLKVSVIVPVYKVEPYLDRCVESLISQTYENIEIILVDDGSPDNSGKMCDAWSTRDKRITVLHKENGGLSDARNCGMAHANGEYILFVDSDDYISCDACEKLCEYAVNGYDIIIGDAQVEGGRAFLNHIECDKVMSGEEYLLAAYKQGKAPMAVWLNMYKREFLVSNGLTFKKGILHEDEEFTPRVLLLSKSVIVTDICFYHYILRDNSITTKKDKRKNASDLYCTCLELEKLYLSLDNDELKKYLLNSLSDKYLNMFMVGKLYRYGKEYLKKDLIGRCAMLPRTKRKAMLYRFSARLYYLVNKLAKVLIKG